jgi:hypothetical protein
MIFPYSGNPERPRFAAARTGSCQGVKVGQHERGFNRAARFWRTMPARRRHRKAAMRPMLKKSASSGPKTPPARTVQSS